MIYDSGDYPAVPGDGARGDRLGRLSRPARRRRCAEGRLIGIGIANAMKGTGRGPFESGVVRVCRSGRITVYTGAAAMGQGLKPPCWPRSARASSACAGGRPGDRRRYADVPIGLGGFASRQAVNGRLLGACWRRRAVAQKAKRLASHVLEVAEEDLEFADGSVRVGRAATWRCKLGDIARDAAAARRAIAFPGPEHGAAGLQETAHFMHRASPMPMPAMPSRSRSIARPARCVILRYVALQRLRPLDQPDDRRRPDHGGIVHGIGNALFERMGYDETGAAESRTNFAEYLLPTATEVPDDRD